GAWMSKVLLIYPEFLLREGPSFNVPISMLQLGSYVESKGVQVRLIDCNIEGNYMNAIYDELDSSVCVGISAMTAHLPSAMQISRDIKKKAGYKGPLVLGGVHPTLFPRQTVLDDLFDFAVVGEGELSFC